MNNAVKMADGADDLLEGLGIPWGGNFNGKDIEGEWFTKSTDLALDWFGPGERPLLYEHGFDRDAGISVVGRVQDYKSTDLGVWTRAQLDKSSEYFGAINELVKAGRLFFSSGSITHLAKKKKSGEITAWPWIELSLTTHPANLLAELDFATAEKHFNAAGIKSAKLDELKALDDAAEAAITDDATKATLPKPKARRKAAKDLPAGPTLLSDDDGGPYPEGSYEDLATDIAMALRAQSGSYAYVQATFPGYALVCICGDGDDASTCYRVAYTLDENGEPILGEMQEVEPAMIAVADGTSKAAELPILQTDEAPLAIQAARLSEYAALLMDRTQGVQERRIKEGRVLSTANRDRLATTADALDGALKAIRDLLQSTEPVSEAKAVTVDRMASINRELEGLQLWASVSLP